MTKLSKMLQLHCVTSEIKPTILAEEVGIERRRFAKILKGNMPSGEELNKINTWQLS